MDELNDVKSEVLQLRRDLEKAAGACAALNRIVRCILLSLPDEAKTKATQMMQREADYLEKRESFWNDFLGRFGKGTGRG